MKLRFVSSFALLAAVLCLACNPFQTRQLQSITVTPLSADAKDYPNGQVQFIATGHYNISPLTVAQVAATWGTCTQQITATKAVAVTQSGLAQCAAGASGTYTVWANDPLPSQSGTVSCLAETACGGGCTIQASAQITCP